MPHLRLIRPQGFRKKFINKQFFPLRELQNSFTLCTVEEYGNTYT